MQPLRYATRTRVWSTDLGLACCALETRAAQQRGAVLRPETPDDPASDLDVLLVSGTVTTVLAPLVRRRYDELAAAGPVRVVSIGACADSGGPYWDSYAVTPGVDGVIPVDVWVPGCPPRPEAILDALARLTAERVSA